MKTIIEVQEFSDYDVLTTNCIMVHAEFLRVADLKKEFCEKEQISDFDGLPYNKLNVYTKKFISFLKDKGFKVLETKCVYFCD